VSAYDLWKVMPPIEIAGWTEGLMYNRKDNRARSLPDPRIDRKRYKTHNFAGRPAAETYVPV
jgi:hypothetical protein